LIEKGTWSPNHLFHQGARGSWSGKLCQPISNQHQIRGCGSHYKPGRQQHHQWHPYWNT
jgi:hypothetical protein